MSVGQTHHSLPIYLHLAIASLVTSKHVSSMPHKGDNYLERIGWASHCHMPMPTLKCVQPPRICLFCLVNVRRWIQGFFFKFVFCRWDSLTAARLAGKMFTASSLDTLLDTSSPSNNGPGRPIMMIFVAPRVKSLGFHVYLHFVCH